MQQRPCTTAMAKSTRLKKEIPMLQESPPPGVQCWQVGDAMDRLEAVITGPENSPVGHLGKLRILMS